MKRFRHIYSDARTGFLGVGRDVKTEKRRRKRDVSDVMRKAASARQKVGDAASRMPFARMESFGRSFLQATDEAFGVNPKPAGKRKARKRTRRKRRRTKRFSTFSSPDPWM